VDAKPHLSTTIIEGHSLSACGGSWLRARECGLQILTWPQLAARLAGGFVQPIAPELLEPAIQSAIAAKGFKELDRVCELPSKSIPRD
jgi:hypothetical protein